LAHVQMRRGAQAGPFGGRKAAMGVQGCSLCTVDGDDAAVFPMTPPTPRERAEAAVERRRRLAAGILCPGCAAGYELYDDEREGYPCHRTGTVIVEVFGCTGVAEAEQEDMQRAMALIAAYESEATAAEEGWRIDVPPEDTSVLVWRLGYVVHIDWYKPDEEAWTWTHWQPLPPAPPKGDER
jgi:hypothetical protein